MAAMKLRFEAKYFFVAIHYHHNSLTYHEFYKRRKRDKIQKFWESIAQYKN